MHLSSMPCYNFCKRSLEQPHSAADKVILRDKGTGTLQGVVYGPEFNRKDVIPGIRQCRHASTQKLDCE